MDGKPLVNQFIEDINSVIDKYRDQGLMVSETIGAIEMVKLDIYNELRDYQNNTDRF